MRAYVVGNATIDEAFAVAALPLPGESIKAQAVDRCLGGKGANQAIILSRCGVETLFITAIAGDARGEEIRQLLLDEPLATRFVECGCSVSDQSILVSSADGENVVLSTTDCAEELNLNAVAPLLASARPEDSLILQGNLKIHATQELLEFAQKAGLRTVFNPSPVHADFIHLGHLVDTIFLNESESLTLTGETGTAAADALLQQGSGTVVLTLGAKGALLAADNSVTHIPSNPTEVIDTTGAGDTFMAAVIASSLRRSCPIDTLAIQHGHEAAAVTISRHGTVSAFPGTTELTALLEKNADAGNTE